MTNDEWRMASPRPSSPTLPASTAFDIRNSSFASPMQPLPHTRSCFVCGEANPLGLRLRFHTDGQIVRATYQPRPEHIGFANTVHGGLLATLLDEIMVWACAVRTRRFAYCAEMSVRYAHPARPGEELHATAELFEDRRGKLFLAQGELRNPAGLVLATATGKYLPMKGDVAAGMVGDLVGDWSAFVDTGKCVAKPGSDGVVE